MQVNPQGSVWLFNLLAKSVIKQHLIYHHVTRSVGMEELNTRFFALVACKCIHAIKANMIAYAQEAVSGKNIGS